MYPFDLKKGKKAGRWLPCAIAFAALLVFGGAAFACSWAAYTASPVSMVARTMDWYVPDDAVVKGHGRGIEVKAADTPNALVYKSKYASMQVHSFADAVIEAMNEKGLQCSMLFLLDSELPAPQPERKDVAALNFVSYVVSNFATVGEALEGLSKINISASELSVIPAEGGAPLDAEPGNPPLHFAVADTDGDRAVIEFWEGKVKIYHGKDYDAMTNEPNYDIHLYLDSAGYQPTGSILPADRRCRAKLYLEDMRARKTEGHDRILLAMRGLLATVNAGTEQIDRIEDEVYPTIWSVVADQDKKAYYLSRYNTWNTEFYDFSMFDVEKPEVVALKSSAVPPALK